MDHDSSQPELTAAERQQLLAWLAIGDAMEAHRRARPSDWYVPHAYAQERQHTSRQSVRLGRTSGQLQGHQATHIIRVAAPGNGWGGTTWMGCELDAWVTHSNRWQETPAWPIRAVWFCPQFRQFDIVRKNLEEYCLSRPYQFRTSGFGGPRYEFPDESTVYLCSYDTSWSHIQGIELDLCCFDEQPPADLWREMLMRRRAKRKTRYICKATQTGGLSWMAKELYQPWLEWHRARGYAEHEALDLQLHPEIWCWSMGGIHDNPAASDEDCRFYENRRWTSEKEARVRLFGGFESWVGDPVFNAEALERMRQRAEERRQTTPDRHGMLHVTVPTPPTHRRSKQR